MHASGFPSIPGSYGAIAEDQSGQSLDLGIVFGH
jgi:hypothetical protein